MFEKLLDELSTWLWSARPEPMPYWKRIAITSGQLAFRLYRDVSEGHITLRAMSLVFTTLLAIVPLLAVSFSVLKGFGVHNQLEPLLLSVLEPLGDEGVEITEKIIGFVENIRVGVLGTLGLGFLFYSAISLIQKVESAFNAIWHLKQSRSVLRRISDYLSVMIIGPIFIFTALGLSATLQSNEFVQSILAIEPLGTLYRSGIRLLPYILVISAFTFFYMFIPNTRVKLKAALIGGIISGVVWQSASWGFASFVVGSTKYTAIYSGFAILIFFMIWVYLNWLILLLGADLVFHIQHPENLAVQKKRMQLSIAEQESLALQVLCVIGRAFYAGKYGATTDDLSRELKVPGKLLDESLSVLLASKLIACSDMETVSYMPAKPFDDTSVKQALDAIRNVPNYYRSEIGKGFSAIQEALKKADQQVESVLSDISLKQLALADS